MDVKSAAIQVLQLQAEDIVEEIMVAGLWQSEGKTPDGTVSARFYFDIKNKGTSVTFVKVGPETFALRDSTVIRTTQSPLPQPLTKPKIRSCEREFFVH